LSAIYLLGGLLSILPPPIIGGGGGAIGGGGGGFAVDAGDGGGFDAVGGILSVVFTARCALFVRLQLGC